MPVTDQAFVTLVTNDIYCQGALVLGKSLRNHSTSRKLVVMITSHVTSRMRGVLAHIFDEVVEVDALNSADSVRLALLRRPELGITFTKLQCWTLTRYTKCVYMDADTIVLCNIDELFDRDELSAAPDSGWPDCFNSGVFVFKPSVETFNSLLQFADNHGSFDGGDQGLLNSFFNNWAVSDIHKHLPFIYNLSISSVYTYSPAFKQFGSEAKVVHFIGTPKPWNLKYNPQTKSVVEDESLSGQHNLSFLVLWWEIYISDVLPFLTETAVSEGSTSEQHNFGRIELVMKNENPPPVCSPEAPNDIAEKTLPDYNAEQQTFKLPDYNAEQQTFKLPDYNAEQQSFKLPDFNAEQQTFDDRVQGQDFALPTEMSIQQPVTQEDDDFATAQLAQTASELSIQEAEEKLRTEEERRNWEQGHIDYMGKYSFDNIQKKLDRFLQ
ncbi:glycogenin-2 isoform X1 [Pelobates fuscus]|uniref:glycogenin-2 isoform X1 n=1 Tax=Pelobates fuscus TaxID=191477 RepID=UPI002FE4EBE2